MRNLAIEAAERFTFAATSSRGDVSALLLRPKTATSLLILGHGAGAGMTHPFLDEFVELLATSRVATLRYQFPYMEAGKRRPDHGTVLQATVRSAIRTAHERAPELPLFAAGKSMGGRMTSLAAARQSLDHVRGLVFVGFPLHPAGKPGIERAEHLKEVDIPMLFLQGTRDRLAILDLLRTALEPLATRARLHIVDGADHSFQMLKTSGRSQTQAIEELAQTTADWIGNVIGQETS